MWSVPVCVCCTDVANVYRAGASCGFRARGHSLSLERRVDTDTTRPEWDHRALTRRQSVVPCYVLSHGTDSEQGNKLESSLKPTDMSVLDGKFS